MKGERRPTQTEIENGDDNTRKEEKWGRKGNEGSEEGMGGEKTGFGVGACRKE
jgi:hypothetical protein